uniref:Uncharacterized protein n=1 Tax=Ciona intestinalis TaxID=7719 RepID=H2XZH6_CIOIN
MLIRFQFKLRNLLQYSSHCLSSPSAHTTPGFPGMLNPVSCSSFPHSNISL